MQSEEFMDEQIDYLQQRTVKLSYSFKRRNGKSLAIKGFQIRQKSINNPHAITIELKSQP